MTCVTRKVLDQHEIDEPHAYLAEEGMGPGFVEIDICTDHARTLAYALEFGDHVGHCLVVADDEAGIAGRCAAVTFARRQARKDVLEPDAFCGCSVLE